MPIVSPSLLWTVSSTHTSWAVSSPVFVIVAVVSRQVRPQLAGVPESRAKSTGFLTGTCVVGGRVRTGVSVVTGEVVRREVAGLVRTPVMPGEVGRAVGLGGG
ncbi:MAG: hypothetical protein LUQ25_00160, partial [Methanoregulaceae archaeon]|nr:hypothetical protein [Methanoregulaceae archaeon]